LKRERNEKIKIDLEVGRKEETELLRLGGGVNRDRRATKFAWRRWR
jgi:hypothetical protein